MKLIINRIRTLINNKDYEFNQSSRYEINESECIDDINDDFNNNIDDKLHSLRLSKL